MSSCSPPPPPAQGSSPNNHNNNNKMDDDDEDEEPSYDDVDICFPSMGGDDAAADDTMMFLPTVGSSDDRLLCESTSNEPPLPRPPTGATTTIAAPTTSSSSMKIPIGKSPRRHHSEDDFSPIPPQGDNDNDNEQQIVVSVGSHPSSTKRSGGGGFFQEVPPRRSTSSTSQQQQSSPQQSLWRNLTDHLEPSLRHLSSSSLNDSLGLATASYSQHGSPLGGTSRAAAAAVASTGGSRPYLTLHHLHTHGLLDGSAIPSRSSSMSAESFEDPPLAMSPRYYGSDDDDGNSSRAGSSVAYGLCGGSSHSSLFEHTPQEFQSIGTTSTPPLSPPVMMSSVSPRTTRLLRGGPGFGSLGTPGANSGARYGHIPHASTMFPSDSPLDLDKRN
ncbi:Hypothetical protein, putative [Bodo saltans]|uniref:Uncharacterized protein n=1 Tax=Bodo saltans TaxID=75058 RepID=A0A0S4JRU7_BODSA|nr:Hypothetical protein, putative [Bodo saltans]|eukprot:CUG92938.1 Hypothetical protein, putative [Bodo saltans]